jgi:hypothetical protein
MDRDDFISIDAIRFGLDSLGKNLRFFIVLMIIVAILYNLPDLIRTYFSIFQIPDGTHSTETTLMSLLTIFVSIIIYLIVELGLLRIALKFKDNKKVEFKDLFRGYPLLIKYLLATIFFGLMIVLPFLPAIAVGTFADQGTSYAIIYIIALLITIAASAFLYLKYQFYDYFIVDRGCGPIEALQHSGRATKGVLKQLLIFWAEAILGIALALGMVSIFIEIPVGIILGIISEDLAPLAGDLVNSAIRLLVIVPLIKLATADIYRRLEWRSPSSALSDQAKRNAGIVGPQ